MKAITLALAALLSLSGCATYSGDMFARDAGYVVFGAIGMALGGTRSTYRPDIYKRPAGPAVRDGIRRFNSEQEFLQDLNRRYYGKD